MSKHARRGAATKRANRSGEQTLRPRARFLRTFGDELISSETVALIELVKNSYDADATRVLIRFIPPFESGKGAIEVIDNGHGMSLDTIRTAWMEPATPSKTIQTRSETFRRRVLGEKGIGRFAASRLAKQLTVITKRDGADAQTTVFFDWTQFDEPDVFLDEIKVTWEEESPQEFTRFGTLRDLWQPEERPRDADLRHGTILRMSELNSDWNEEEFKRLTTGLSRLVSPFSLQEGQNGATSSDDFKIRLEVPEPTDDLSGEIGPSETLRSAHYSLQGEVDEYGGYTIIAQLKDREPEEIVSEPFSDDELLTACGPFRIRLHVWDRDTASIGELANMRGTTRSEVRSDLNAATGINIYRDGFRVLPYGESANDWLRLDLRRVQNPTLRLSNNQILGYILISSDSNPLLKDQSNREGIIEGPALEQLKGKLIKLLTLLEARRYSLRERRPRGRSPKSGLFLNFTLEDVSEYVRNRHADNPELIALVSEKAAELDRRVEEVQEVLSRYHRLATLGSLVDIVLHNGRSPLAKIAQAALMAKRDIGRGRQISTVVVEKLKRRLDAVSSQATVLQALFRRIEPFGGRRRGQPFQIEIERVISDAVSVLSSECLRLGVKVELPKGSTKMTVLPTDLQEVIVNLLSNSLHWLQQVKKADRRIKIEVSRIGSNEIQVLFSDSGPGVEPQFADSIFDPYFSTKPDGVGLGLTITGDIVSDYYGGTIELLNSGPLPGATFRITLRK